MFERFTERARQVVLLAQGESRSFKHGYIGTEHLLLGLLAQDDALASRVLVGLGMSLDGTRHDVERIVGLGESDHEGQPIPFTPRAKKVLEFALREALSLGHNYIGTEHVLLGFVREGEGVGMRIVRDFDLDAEKVRDAVIAALHGKPSDEAA